MRRTGDCTAVDLTRIDHRPAMHRRMRCECISVSAAAARVLCSLDFIGSNGGVASYESEGQLFESARARSLGSVTIGSELPVARQRNTSIESGIVPAMGTTAGIESCCPYG